MCFVAECANLFATVRRVIFVCRCVCGYFFLYGLVLITFIVIVRLTVCVKKITKKMKNR